MESPAAGFDNAPKQLLDELFGMSIGYVIRAPAKSGDAEDFQSS